MGNRLFFKGAIASITAVVLGMSTGITAYNAMAAGVSPKLMKSEPNPQFSGYLNNRSSISVENGLIPSPLSFTKSNISLNKDTLLPSKYDLRLLDRLTVVKDQGSIGSCWSFAAYSAMESNMLSAGLGSYDFSENNMITQHGFDAGPDGGGNITMSTAYLARWAGPVLESKDPYPTVAKPENVVRRNGLTADKHLQEMLNIPARNNYLDNADIKTTVMKYGAMDSAIRYDGTFLNYSNCAYYNYVPVDRADLYTYANHEVTIVGWDDNYPASNFKQLPPGNGAFIARNNWGSSWGDKGYFYISYYDTILGTENGVFTKVESNVNYSNIYQYDELGMILNFGYRNPTAWFANVFNYSFTPAKKESVQAVGFYTTKKNTSYELFFESDFDNKGFNSLIKVGTGIIDMPGYHTVKFDIPQTMVLGNRFAVAVKLYAPGELYPIGVEYAEPGFSSKAVSDYRQSFVSGDGVTWDDMKEAGNELGVSNANVCLKVYTDISYDLNSDNKIDILDLAQLSKWYNIAYGTSTEYKSFADLNDDGIIDLLDLVLMSSKISR